MKITLLLSTMFVSCIRSFVVVSKRRLSTRQFATSACRGRHGCQSNSPGTIHLTTRLSLAQNERTEDSERTSDLTSLQSWYEKYYELSERRPYPTKALSASVVVALGSILSQWVEAKSGNVPLVMNWHMIRAFALTGLVFEGPYLHWWYEQLFRLGRFLDSGGIPSRARTLAQILVDETIGVMLFFPSYFVAYEISQSFLLFRGELWSKPRPEQNRMWWCCTLIETGNLPIT